MDSHKHSGMNKAFFLPKEQREPRWLIVDAKGLVLGRLATRIANALRGKDKAYFTPHTDSGDYVVVINADKVVLTGNKWNDKIYERYTGYIGGLRTATAKEVLKKHPTRLIKHAVEGMLPKNKLSDQIVKKLKIYASDQHPHAAHTMHKLI